MLPFIMDLEKREKGGREGGRERQVHTHIQQPLPKDLQKGRKEDIQTLRCDMNMEEE